MNTENTKTEDTKDLKSEVLARIEREQVVPESKMRCALRSSVFWVLLVISILVGAEAVAVMIFSTSSVGWELYSVTHDSFLEFAVAALPLMWIVAVGLAVVAAYFNMRHTKRGYRYSPYSIVLMGIGGSIVGGTLLYAVGTGHKSEMLLERHIPIYQSATRFEENSWTQPERGLYGGVVEGVTDEMLEIRGFDDEVHVFKTTHAESPHTKLEEGDTVHIIAVPTTTGVKKDACAVFERSKVARIKFGEMKERRLALKESMERHLGGERVSADERIKRNPCLDAPVIDRRTLRKELKERVNERKPE